MNGPWRLRNLSFLVVLAAVLQPGCGGCSGNGGGDGDLDIISIGWGHANVLLYENLAR